MALRKRYDIIVAVSLEQLVEGVNDYIYEWGLAWEPCGTVTVLEGKDGTTFIQGLRKIT